MSISSKAATITFWVTVTKMNALGRRIGFCPGLRVSTYTGSAFQSNDILTKVTFWTASSKNLIDWKRAAMLPVSVYSRVGTYLSAGYWSTATASASQSTHANFSSIDCSCIYFPRTWTYKQIHSTSASEDSFNKINWVRLEA